jgi:SusD family.
MKLKYIPLLLVLFACKKSFLEIDPKGKLVAKTVNDYDLLLNNNDFLNTGGANAQVFLGDEVAAAEPYFATSEPRTQRLFQWEPVVYEPQEDAAETSALLRQLYVYNKIINEIGDAGNGTEARKNAIRAEARAGRAWVYFQLINYFGKPYNPASAASDPGFPVIKAADVTATQFNRAPVQEVYDFIIDDLVTAIPDLPVQTSYRLRMAKPAAEALLGKVYMFMGQFDKALPLLDDALDHLQSASISIQLIDYNTAFAPGGMFLPISFFGPTTPVIGDDPETIYARQFSNFWITSSELVINPATVALFGASDLRLNFYANTPFPIGPEYPAGLLRRTGPLTTSYGVVLPDVILLRAECRARTNDLAGAVADVESLRLKRMPAADAPVPAEASATQKKMIEYILDERIREFASQGVRWYDMRRLSVDPLFANIQYSHTVYAEDGTPRTIDMPAERLVLKMPPKIMNENPGMEDNQ